MSLSAFGDKAAMPDDAALSNVLCTAKALWDNITEHITATYDNVGGEWKFYSKEAGWSFAVKSGKRTLVYLIPQKGSFKANFVFGEKAVASAQSAGLPENILKEINKAQRYAEGRSFMIDIHESENVNTVTELIRIKDRN
jgi:hypothetical protein